MGRYNGSSSRSTTLRSLLASLVMVGLSCCHGLSLGQSPLQGGVYRAGSLSRSTSTMLFGASQKRTNAHKRLSTKSTSVHRYRKQNQQNEGSELYGYLDRLDRQSGLNYNDYWGRKRNTTDLVDSMKNVVDSTPKPFNKLVSEEMWYVSLSCKLRR